MQIHLAKQAKKRTPGDPAAAALFLATAAAVQNP